VKALKEIPLPPLDIERFRDVLPAGDYRAVEGAAQHAREVFDGRVIWHVNSTGRGGGVAEMLHTRPTRGAWGSTCAGSWCGEIPSSSP
jgi:trehalose synthase